MGRERWRRGGGAAERAEQRGWRAGRSKGADDRGRGDTGGALNVILSDPPYGEGVDQAKVSLLTHLRIFEPEVPISSYNTDQGVIAAPCQADKRVGNDIRGFIDDSQFDESGGNS